MADDTHGLFSQHRGGGMTPPLPLNLGSTYILQLLCVSDLLSLPPPGLFLPLFLLRDPLSTHVTASWWIHHAPAVSRLPHPCQELTGAVQTLLFHSQSSVSGLSRLHHTPFSGFPSCCMLMPGCLARQPPPRKEKAPLCSASSQCVLGYSLWPILPNFSSGLWSNWTSFPSPHLSLIPSDCLPYCPKNHPFPFLMKENSLLCYILCTFPGWQVIAALFFPRVSTFNVGLMADRNEREDEKILLTRKKGNT